jgi:hypothetical protein
MMQLRLSEAPAHESDDEEKEASSDKEVILTFAISTTIYAQTSRSDIT